VEDTVKSEIAQEGIWEDYVHGLLSGRLSPAEGDDVLQSVAPERLAAIVNEAAENSASEESYDRVITSYIRRKGESRLSTESLEKLATLIDNLSPAVKGQFLTRTFHAASADMAEVERVLGEMTREGFERLVTAFAEHGSAVPETLKNLIDKLSTTPSSSRFSFDIKYAHSAVLHDIELDEDVLKLFDDDHFTSYVSADYQEDLERMLQAQAASTAPEALADILREAEEVSVDRSASEVMLEVIQSDVVSREEYLNVLSRLAELSAKFVDTGRFEEALNVYNTLRSQTYTGRFTHEAQSTITYFFHADAFVKRFMEAVHFWGRNNRDGVVRFCRALKNRIAGPLLDTLAEEQNAGIRRFILSVLAELSDAVLPEAVKRLKDSRWYVVRNMIYLIRLSDDAANAGHVRAFVKSTHIPVAMEALRTLLHFRTTDAIPHLKVALQSEEDEMRAQAAALAGAHRVREAVPLLIETVGRRDVLGTMSVAKIPAVRALGEIGAPEALEPLAALLRSRSLLFRGGLDELKLEIFTSLGRYPFDAARPLIELGLSSPSAEIRSVCERLITRRPPGESHDD
jgi:HEAT repeat protein